MEGDALHIKFTHSERHVHNVVVFAGRRGNKTYQCPDCGDFISTNYKYSDLPKIDCGGTLGPHSLWWFGPEPEGEAE